MQHVIWKTTIFLICILISTNSWSENSASEDTNKYKLSDNSRRAITIQVSSHKKVEAAERELIRLKSHNLDAFISHEHVKDKGMWYRVLVGQFENSTAATGFANSLVDKKIISGFWLKRQRFQ